MESKTKPTASRTKARQRRIYKHGYPVRDKFVAGVLTLTPFLFHFLLFSDVLLRMQRWTAMQQNCAEKPEKLPYWEIKLRKFLE